MAPNLVHKRVLPWTPVWPLVRDLYVASFPAEERIPLTYLVLCELFRPSCRFLAWFLGDTFAGLTFTFRRRDVTLLLFIAVAPHMRSTGVGAQLLHLVAQPHPGGVTVLQLEPRDASAPNATQRERRHNFYMRNGFRTSPLVSIEAGERYATMLKGRDLEAAEFEAVLKSLMLGTRSVQVR